MIEIDDVAARQRLQEIVAANKAALEARVRQAAELAEQAKAAAEAEEAALAAARGRKAEAEAELAAAEQAAEDEADETDEPEARPRPPTMSLGADEFKLDRQARQAAEQQAPVPRPPSPTPPRNVTEEPAPTNEPPRPGRTLKLGARDDDEPVQQDKPARKRPPRPEVDDDMSGRTWLR